MEHNEFSITELNEEYLRDNQLQTHDFGCTDITREGE